MEGRAMMRGVTVELPDPAREKLAAIELQRDAALDLMRGANSRAMSLPRDAVGLREKLEVERDRFAERHRVLAMLVSRLNQWHVELRLGPNIVLELAPVVEVKLKASETCAAALASVRESIARTQQEIAQVRKAPLRRSSQQEAVRAYLARLAQQVRPKVGFDARGGASVRWIEDMATMDAVLGLLAFVVGSEQVTAAFTRQLEEEPEAPGALSPLEREKKVNELAIRLLELERVEESLIGRAADEGIELARRGDASPLAVLGVAIVAREAAAA
jgi:hypothetical protein